MAQLQIIYKRNPPHRDVFDEYALRIGRVSIAWNALHEKFYSMFAWIVSRPEDRNLAYGIWHSVQNDSAQRGFLRAAAASTKDKRFIRAVDWIIKQADKLGSDRNALIHSAVVFSFGEDMKPRIEPSRFSTREAHLKRLEMKPTARDWERVTGNLLLLSQYATYIEINEFYELPPQMQKAWPRRPRLLGLEGSTKPRRPPKKNKTQKRQPPRRSSRT